jgi:hypothetical protein
VRSKLRTGGIVLLTSAVLLCATGTALADVYTVTRTDDPAPGACLPSDCSLREALAASNASTTVDDQIVLPDSAVPYAVELESKPLEATDSVEVKGAAADRVQIKGNGSNFILFVTGASPVVVLEGLTITGGKGGIQNNGDLTLRRVSVEKNSREGGGGAIQSNGPLKLESSFIGFNSATAASGGIHSNGAVTILNSTIAHNSSESIGGVGGNSSVTISNSAVVFNTSTGTESPGIGGSPLTIQDSIFAGNKDSAGAFNCGFSIEDKSLGGNVSDDASCGAGAADRASVDPRLGTLALHGGTTPLYALLADSPAVDFAGQCLSPDQRGIARPQGARCDSGPYELIPLFEPPPPPRGDRELVMRLGKGKLKMDRKGRIRVRLTCPVTEASPPCRGRVVVKSKRGWPVRSCDCPRLMIAYNAGGRFSIPTGKTRSVVARLPRGAGRILDRWKPRKVLLLVTAEDAAGNRQEIKGFRKLVPR